jgi:hypothetical protein
MGEFTQNLLKLTEFPFSYSLMGLLALIFGQGINLEELSYAKVGPLLILVGFVATTLSICDPVGAFQRFVLKGTVRRWYDYPVLRTLRRWAMSKGTHRYIAALSTALLYALSFPLRLVYKERGRRSYDQIIIDEFLDAKYFGNTVGSEFPLPYIFAIGYTPEDIKHRYNKIRWGSIQKFFHDTGGYLRIKEGNVWTEIREYDQDLEQIQRAKIARLLDGLKHLTVKTKWITAEVDRITALVYFIITISVFISAIMVITDFLPKFTEPFGNVVFSKLGILTFSVIALIAVTYMFILRIKELQSKARTVFKCLTASGAIKTDKEKKYKTALDEIERYMDDNHWPLAEYWVDHVIVDYSEFFLEECKK